MDTSDNKNNYETLKLAMKNKLEWRFNETKSSEDSLTYITSSFTLEDADPEEKIKELNLQVAYFDENPCITYSCSINLDSFLIIKENNPKFVEKLEELNSLSNLGYGIYLESKKNIVYRYNLWVGFGTHSMDEDYLSDISNTIVNNGFGFFNKLLG